MKAIRRHLKRAQARLYRSRRSLERAHHHAIAKSHGPAYIAAISVALADNAELHQHIDDIAAMLDLPRPHMRAWRQ